MLASSSAASDISVCTTTREDEEDEKGEEKRGGLSGTGSGSGSGLSGRSRRVAGGGCGDMHSSAEAGALSHVQAGTGSSGTGASSCAAEEQVYHYNEFV